MGSGGAARARPLNPSLLAFHELIGLRVRVLRHYDPGLEGLEGVVYWETARTLVVKSRGRLARVLKPGSILAFELPDGSWAAVKGEEILGRPEERAARMRWSRRARAQAG